MVIKRRKSRVIKIGNVFIGGDYPVAIQSMTKADTSRIDETIKQINELEKAGCEIVRVAIKTNQDAAALRKIKRAINIPVVADIHFNWRLAIEAIDSGADKVRLNPGNIFRPREIKEIIAALKSAKIPLRIGLNSGSVRSLNSKNLNIADKLVKSALDYIRKVQKLKFYDIVISLKASNVADTVEAYRKLRSCCDYPLHLGVTATGSPYKGLIKSSIAIGCLLLEGTGDTIRVSLTDDPVNEVKAAKAILESLGIRSFGPEIISCPTCGRCEVDLIKIVKDLENRLSAIDYRLSTRPIKVAVMGCVVNGPGEAKEADIGVAFGKDKGVLFIRGKPVKKVSFSACVSDILKYAGEQDD
jgi:(E)-4-hydroxy-3-methylbut-2-enyl-diphosphate synthase